MNHSPSGLRLRPVVRPSLRADLEPFRQCSRPWAKPNGQGAMRRVETPIQIGVIMNETSFVK